MLDKMNHTPIDNDYLAALEEGKEALSEIVQKIQSNDDDGQEFIISLNHAEKEKLVDALTGILNKHPA